MWIFFITIFIVNKVTSQTFYYYNPTVIPSQGISTTYNGQTSSGKYITILGKDHSQIVKPLIIVEGFDPLNNQGFQEHINLYNNNSSNASSALLYNLYNNNFDVIILNFDTPNDYIQNNSMLLVNLINRINSLKAESGDNMVVMGFSMGGLVARYALAWMEANGQNHQTRIYISHDTPHKGANFPLGFQEFIEDFRSKNALAWLAADILLRSIDYSYPAAKQMLIYHYSNSKDGMALPADEKVAFFNELYNLNPAYNGYPSKPLKLAISNGNYSGFPQSGLNPGDVILGFSYLKNNPGCITDRCNLWQLIWNNCGPCHPFKSDEITVSIRAGFTNTEPLEEFYLYSMGLKKIGNSNFKSILGGSGEQYFSANNFAYDNASGSISSYYLDKMRNSISTNLGVTVNYKNNLCFIPTISALDLNIGLNTPFNLNGSKCLSVFDYMYANPSANNEHWSFSSGAENFVLKHILANETPVKLAAFSIPANTIVSSDQRFKVIASGDISNSGDFNLMPSGDASLTSGTSITLNSGLNMALGSTLEASVSPDVCTSGVIFEPNYLTKLKSSLVKTAVYKDYDCSNYQEEPNYSSDSLYFNCGGAEIFDVDSIFDANISIYPNPTPGNITIAFSNEIQINKVELKVFDIFNNLVYYQNPVNSTNISFDVSSCPNGLITLQFIINSGVYVYSRKIIKQ